MLNKRVRSGAPWLARAGVAALMLAGTGSGAKAQTGTVTGTVTDEATLRPLSSAQVSIPGTGLGTLTDARGQFLILNVPAGEVTLQVDLIGYARSSQGLTVSSGGTATTQINLSHTAISLEEIVVTGSAVSVEKRTLGNSVSTVDASTLTDKMPITSVDELIMGRSAGVNLGLSSGGGNFGGQIRIRGTTSASLRGDPIMYVDGVRVDARQDKDSGIGIGGQTISRILDLQPEDIERVEIVKGAAAASLYGTQGSNGVIQIFTKRGRTGKAQWTGEVEQGFERTPTDTFPGALFDRFVGPDGFRAHNPTETVENGYRQRYNLSVSGGSDNTRYYVSSGYKTQEGSIAPNTNWMKQFTARANITSLVTEKVTLTVTSGITFNRLRVPDNDNALHGTYSQFASAVPYTATEDRPFGERFGSFEANQTVENHQRVLRNTTGITIDHKINENLSQRLTAGLDWFTNEFTKYFPFAYQGSGNKLGNKSNSTQTIRDITVDYRLQFDKTLGGQATSTFAVGAQGDFRARNLVFAYGQNFPAPGVRSVSATAITRADETNVEEINAGVFVQETVGLWDKLFVTGGLRVDGNSAFGNNFTTQTYPKVSVAYNISEEDFWPETISTMKVRVAYGESGLAPSQFAADRTYTPTAAQDGVPAVTPGNVGNPALGPERSREVEVGFDAGFLNDRIGLEVTSYFQKTLDAMIRRPFPPSQGFLQAQLTNIGEIANRGVEVSLNGIMVQNESMEWTANAQFSAAHNEVTSLGGVPPFTVSDARIAEGYPVIGLWGYEITGWDPVTRQHSVSDTLLYIGQQEPKWFGSLSSGFRYDRFTVNAMIEFSGGNYRVNFDRYWSIRVRTGDEYLSLLNDERGTATPAADSLRNWAVSLGSGAFADPAGFTSLREVSLSYDLPEAWTAPVGLGSSSIRFAGRNLFLWSEYSGITPETGRRDGTFGDNSSFDTQPIPRVFTLTFRTSW